VSSDNSGSVDKFDLFQRNVNFLKITSLTLFDVSVDSLHASCVFIFSFVLWRFGLTIGLIRRSVKRVDCSISETAGESFSGR